MPEYLHPGVYIEEIERGPKPIEGVPTSTSAFLGATERGPTWPTLCTSYNDYKRWFGSVFGDDKYMPYAVNGFFENGGKRLYVCRITDDAATTATAAFGANFSVSAAGPGLWGTRVYAQIKDSSTMKPGPGNTIVPVGLRLRLAYYSKPPAENPLDWFNDLRKPPFPAYSEDYDDLVTDEKSPDFYEKRLEDSSALATLVRGPNAVPGERPANGFAKLANGADGAPIDIADYRGQIALPNRPEAQGLAALELDPFREVSLVYAPGVGFDVAKAVITHCENMRFRFAVVDCQKNTAVGTFEPRNAVADTKYAGFYYPWIYLSDPMTGATKIVPPGGHVLGIFARSDAEFGVFKAPANEPVRGALELFADTDDATQDVLNPRGINAIREFPGRGIRVWGART
ncbi:MAG: phage tail sheath subtilisin-like domain-containing protein, partial [Steroidobacteraceae bacterium]